MLLAVEALTVKELNMLSKLLGLTTTSGKGRLRERIERAVRTQRTLFGGGYDCFRTLTELNAYVDDMVSLRVMIYV